MVPRRTRSATFRTATKPRNSLVSPSVSRMKSVVTVEERELGSGRGWPVRDGRRQRSATTGVIDGLALLLPRPIRLVRLRGAHAVRLGPEDVLDAGAGVGVKRLVEQALDVTVGRGRLATQLVQHRVERRLDIARRAHARHQADR